MDTESESISREFLAYIRNREFPCIAAKAAVSQEQIHVLVADHLACPRDDGKILHFLYWFIDLYRQSDNLYHSAVIIFKKPGNLKEDAFDELLWNRLQAISDLDALNYPWDSRVGKQTMSANFSYSIKTEALYVIGLHPESSRPSRQFYYPSIVFNPHEQFEKLRRNQKYQSMKEVVRKRDVKLSGTVNPMLADFGESSEVFQYSGRQYAESWNCPFIAKHEKQSEHHTAP
jgi:FPC/CPF motif-containing protein YcgG